MCCSVCNSRSGIFVYNLNSKAIHSYFFRTNKLTWDASVYDNTLDPYFQQVLYEQNLGAISQPLIRELRFDAPDVQDVVASLPNTFA